MSSGRGNTNGVSSAAGPGSCQDCGNKSKRDCEHMRCRTCCKTRGFHCPTHVRSTWIPVARRRQLLHHRLSLSSPSTSFPRAPIRLLTSSSPSSGLQGRSMNPNFPAEVTAVANFRSVRVTSDDNAVDQAAYQASVTIAGHSFKGILYDQGPPSFPDGVGGGGESSSTDHQYLHHHHHHHHLLGLTHPGGSGGGGGVGGGSTSTVGGTGANPTYAAYTHQYPLYASTAPFNPTFLPVSGVQFFPNPKP